MLLPPSKKYVMSRTGKEALARSLAMRSMVCVVLAAKGVALMAEELIG